MSSKSTSSLISLFIFPGLLWVSSCAYGPETKDKSFLQSLNGEHYDPSPATANLSFGSLSSTTPLILHRRRAGVRIAGQLLLSQSSVPNPIAGQTLKLLQDSKPLATVVTDAGGNFTFLGDFEDGPATIHLDSSKFQGELPIEIKGFLLENLKINAEPNHSF